MLTATSPTKTIYLIVISTINIKIAGTPNTFITLLISWFFVVYAKIFIIVTVDITFIQMIMLFKIFPIKTEGSSIKELNNTAKKETAMIFFISDTFIRAKLRITYVKR